MRDVCIKGSRVPGDEEEQFFEDRLIVPSSALVPIMVEWCVMHIPVTDLRRGMRIVCGGYVKVVGSIEISPKDEEPVSAATPRRNCW